MGKNSLDLRRKLKTYHQNIKILRRGLRVQFKTPGDQVTSDFGLGCYYIKPNSMYQLIINVDLPKKIGGELLVDFWGLTNNNHLQHLNQGRIKHSNREQHIKFWSYPKTRHQFMTFRLDYDQTEHDPTGHSYLINYIFLESKTPLPRATETPLIPTNLNMIYDIELKPQLIIDLISTKTQLEIILNSEIPNLEIFEHAILSYLLQRETAPEYLKILQENIKCCQISDKTRSIEDLNNQVNQEKLITLQDEIKHLFEKLGTYSQQIDQMINHKHSLENMLDQTENLNPLQQDQHESQIKIHQKMLKTMNLKLNHLNRLQQINQEIDDLNHENITKILNYYQNRVIQDVDILKQSLVQIHSEYQSYQEKILIPKTERMDKDQIILDQVLVDYRLLKKKSTNLKEKLDQKIIKFTVLWYQDFIQSCQSEILS